MSEDELREYIRRMIAEEGDDPEEVSLYDSVKAWFRAAQDYEREVPKLQADVAKLRTAMNESRRQHQYCDDTYYACPRHPELLRDGTVCSCGADEWNARVDQVIDETNPVP